MSDQMWINAFRLINPSDEFLKGIGQDVVNLMKQSAGRDREKDEPIFDVTIRFVGS